MERELTIKEKLIHTAIWISMVPMYLFGYVLTARYLIPFADKIAHHLAMGLVFMMVYLTIPALIVLALVVILSIIKIWFPATRDTIDSFLE